MIAFEMVGVTIPISRDGVFIRIDDPVSDVEAHQEALLTELGVKARSFALSNQATKARAMHLRFADGKECTFIWTLRSSDERVANIRIEHEKFHALCRTNPEGVGELSRGIRKAGFDLDLMDYDEELSATIVEVLSLHLQGIALEDISGSGHVTDAVAVLTKCNSNKPPAH